VVLGRLVSCVIFRCVDAQSTRDPLSHSRPSVVAHVG
jgi:hypothetical protein